jgi:hypothetical protein
MPLELDNDGNFRMTGRREIRDQLLRVLVTTPPRPQRVLFPSFEVVSNPTISMAELRRRRFDGGNVLPKSIQRILNALLARSQA